MAVYLEPPQTGCDPQNISCDVTLQSIITTPQGLPYLDLRQWPNVNSNYTRLQKYCTTSSVVLRSWNTPWVYQYLNRLVMSFDLGLTSIVPGSIANPKLKLWVDEKYNELGNQDLIVTRWVLDDYLVTYHQGSYGNPIPYVYEEPQDGGDVAVVPRQAYGDWNQWVTSFNEGSIGYDAVVPQDFIEIPLDPRWIERAASETSSTTGRVVGYMLMLQHDYDFRNASFLGDALKQSGFILGNSSSGRTRSPKLEFEYTPGTPIADGNRMIMIA